MHVLPHVDMNAPVMTTPPVMLWEVRQPATADLTPRQVTMGKAAALMRLQTYNIGQTHEALLQCGARIRASLVRYAGDEDGTLDDFGAMRVMDDVNASWREAFGEWRRNLTALAHEAASISFARLAVLHQYYFRPLLQEGGPARPLLEQLGVGVAYQPVYEEQLWSILQAARQRLWSDGFSLSSRIWRLDAESLTGIRSAVYGGIASKASAWQIAQQVERYLGAGAECPRWTRTRLYGLTKSGIAAGDRRGLYSGDRCAGQGVSYNALRLARTELSYAHSLADQTVLEALPFVQMVEIFRSPSGVDCEVCDDIVAQNPYPKGLLSELIPAHPHCLCFSAAVLPDPMEFVDQLRGWVDGTTEWPEMDQYADWLHGAGAGRQMIMGTGAPFGAAVTPLGTTTPEAEFMSSAATEQVDDIHYVKGVHASYIVKLENDGYAIIKPTGKLRFLNELTFYEVAQALGWENLVPTTYDASASILDPDARRLFGEFASGQLWIHDGPTAFNVKDWSGIDSQSYARMTLLDVLLGNVDRHTGNFLIQGGRIIAIDHDAIFRAPDYARLGGIWHDARRRWERKTSTELHVLVDDANAVLAFARSPGFRQYIIERYGDFGERLLDRDIREAISFIESLRDEMAG